MKQFNQFICAMTASLAIVICQGADAETSGIKMLPPAGCPSSGALGLVGWIDNGINPLGCVNGFAADNSGNLTASGQITSSTVVTSGSAIIGGSIKIGPSDQDCSQSSSGSVRYNITKASLEFCDGNSWKSTRPSCRVCIQFVDNAGKSEVGDWQCTPYGGGYSEFAFDANKYDPDGARVSFDCSDNPQNAGNGTLFDHAQIVETISRATGFNSLSLDVSGWHGSHDSGEQYNIHIDQGVEIYSSSLEVSQFCKISGFNYGSIRDTKKYDSPGNNIVLIYDGGKWVQVSAVGHNSVAEAIYCYN